MNVTLPTWDELRLVGPEIWLTLTMCAVVIVPFIRRRSIVLPVVITLLGLALALVSALPLGPQHINVGAASLVFSGALAIDPFSQFFKVLLLVFVIFIVAQWLMTSRHEMDERDAPDFLCLLLGATLGMALMASATNLLTIFIAMETASLPSFALAGFAKHRRRSTEGSLKYVLFGAAASAIGLYGMSLLYGAAGSLDLGTIASQAADGGMTPMFAIGLVAMFSGIAFKLSAVPLHFWCPDVFEGAPIEVTTFLSVASKGAGLCLLLRIVSAFGAAGPQVGLTTGIAILGAVTATWGNLVALHQTNIKRLLAYSSIAHAGYMIMAASLTGLGPDSTVAGAILFYLFIYMFMNLGVFTIAALVSQHTGSEDIRDYSGLARRNIWLTILLSIFLMSLLGMPPLGGFWAKVFLGMAMFDTASGIAFLLIIVLFTNTLISLYYYMKPVYYMVFVSEDGSSPAFSPRVAGMVMVVFCALVLLWTGFLPQWASQLAHDYGTINTKQAQLYQPTAVAPQPPDRGGTDHGGS